MLVLAVSAVAWGPKSTPLGFRRKKFADGIQVRESMSPSIDETVPPVTRATIFAVEPGPVNVAASPARTLNWPKL